MRRQKFALKHLDVPKRVVDLLIRWYARMIEKHSTYCSCLRNQALANYLAPLDPSYST